MPFVAMCDDVPLILPLGNIFSRTCGRTFVLIQIVKTVRSYTVAAESGQHMKMKFIAPVG